jgi:hypothetical protein
LVVCAGGRVGCIVYGSTRRIIDFCVGIGRLRVVGGEFSDRIAGNVPGIGIVGVETSYTSCQSLSFWHWGPFLVGMVYLDSWRTCDLNARR